jgi:hypothetical protein
MTPVKTALTVWLAVALTVHLVVHVSIAIGLARRKQYRRAAFGFVLSPLGALFAWEAGMKWRARVWAITFVAYAAGVAFA